MVLPIKAPPLLQKLVMPPNVRLYKQQMIEWERKYRDMRRPLVILPKKDKFEQLAQQKQEGEGKLPESKPATNTTQKLEQLKRDDEKRVSRVSRASRISKASRISRVEEKNDENKAGEDFGAKYEYLTEDEIEEPSIKEIRAETSKSKLKMRQSKAYPRLLNSRQIFSCT